MNTCETCAFVDAPIDHTPCADCIGAGGDNEHWQPNEAADLATLERLLLCACGGSIWVWPRLDMEKLRAPICGWDAGCIKCAAKGFAHTSSGAVLALHRDNGGDE